QKKYGYFPHLFYSLLFINKFHLHCSLANAPSSKILLGGVIEEKSRFMINHKIKEAPKNDINHYCSIIYIQKCTKHCFKAT
ncbi:hypothetical protein, partial [Bacillus thuringiensis]|uniref:hypothetical protein n=1 Tax=Bacillus thuringiensis TaxID=1428 RepID=UPI0021E8F6E3